LRPRDTNTRERQSPRNDPNRRTRVQKVYWRADGTPAFGIPVPDGPTPARLMSYDTPGQALRHRDYRVRLEADVSPLADSQFRLVTGLSGSDTVPLESTDFPGYYLRHRDFEAWVERRDGTSLFDADASFVREAGLSGSGTVSLESVNFPGYFVRHRAGLAWVEQNDGSSAFKGSASFVLERAGRCGDSPHRAGPAAPRPAFGVVLPHRALLKAVRPGCPPAGDP
jgi:hypothetical protein